MDGVILVHGVIQSLKVSKKLRMLLKLDISKSYHIKLAIHGRNVGGLWVSPRVDSLDNEYHINKIILYSFEWIFDHNFQTIQRYQTMGSPISISIYTHGGIFEQDNQGQDCEHRAEGFETP